MNGILHHCSLPTVPFSEREELLQREDISDDDEFSSFLVDQNSTEGMRPNVHEANVRPGIVHRLDKGTSGLLVVAKVSSHSRYSPTQK